MKKSLLVLAVAVAAVTVPAASAGGWATVGLSSLPAGTAAGDEWPVELTVLQHGRTPLDGIEPVLTISNADGESATFTGVPTGKPGVYRADVVFPSEGTWTYSVWDDFSRTHTFKPVEISGSSGSFPLAGIAVSLALAAALAAATVVVLRRRRPEPQPIQLKEAT